jgi:hypothetical protein
MNTRTHVDRHYDTQGIAGITINKLATRAMFGKFIALIFRALITRQGPIFQAAIIGSATELNCVFCSSQIMGKIINNLRLQALLVASVNCSDAGGPFLDKHAAYSGESCHYHRLSACPTIGVQEKISLIFLREVIQRL